MTMWQNPGGTGLWINTSQVKQLMVQQINAPSDQLWYTVYTWDNVSWFTIPGTAGFTTQALAQTALNNMAGGLG